MNNEQQQIIDEAYKKYADSHWTPPSNPKGKLLSDQLCSIIPMEHSKETFINECKRNTKFSEKWGLKIEERELTIKNRYDLLIQKMSKLRAIRDEDYINYNIPTKLITVTYKDKTIESYE